MIEVRIKKHPDKTFSVLVRGKRGLKYATANGAGLDKKAVKARGRECIEEVSAKLKGTAPG